MAGIYEDASELEKLIHNCEFENQQYVKLIEKEKQLIEALEREIEEKKGETKRLQEAITQLDNDTKHYHKQFTINRDNCENLKKTSQVLTEHLAAMNNKLEMAVMKRKQENDENQRLLTHYRNIWDGYKVKYEKFPKAQRLQAQQAREEELRVKTQQTKERLDNLRSQVQQLQRKKNCGYGDTENFIIRLAELYVNTQHTMKEIHEKEREIDRRKKEEEERQKEATEANRIEAINQLKEIHLEDRPSSHDQMESETNDVQNTESEELSSPMISVFTGRSDAEEDMQTGEVQAVNIQQSLNLEEPASQDHEQQLVRKPQTWLANYQEQNQKQLQQNPESEQVERKHPHPLVQQKQDSEDSRSQSPFVAFHNTGQEQGSGDMEASVSIHLPTRPAAKANISQPQNRSSLQLQQPSSQSMSQQNSTGFTNPAFQNTKSVPKFILPCVPLRPAVPKTVATLPSKKPATVPQIITNKIPQQSINQASVRSTIPSIQSPQVPASIHGQQRVHSASVQLPSDMPQRFQRPATPNQKSLQSIQIPNARSQSNQNNLKNQIRPVQQLQPRSSPALNQMQAMTSKPPQQNLPQLRPHNIPQSATRVPMSQNFSNVQIPQLSANIRQESAGQPPQSPMQLSQSNNIQVPNRPQVMTSPSVGQSVSQRQRISPPQAPVLSSPKPELQKGGQGQTFGIDQLGLGQEMDSSSMVTSKPKTPEPSPKVVPMQVSPVIGAENESQTQLYTPVHSEAKVPSPEEETGSPFNLEKHKEKLKNINKSPGHPLFTSDRRMFDGAKGDNGQEQSGKGTGQVPDSTPSFMMFGGGDGFGFTPYSEKKIDTSAGLFGGGGGFSFSSQGPTSPDTSNFVTLFGSGSNNDKENSDNSPFSFNFGAFNQDPKSPSGGQGNQESDGSNFAALFGSKSDNQNNDSGFSFNFGSFGGDPKSPPGNSNGGTNLAALFGGTNGMNDGDNNDSGFSFNFGHCGADTKSPSGEKFSFF